MPGCPVVLTVADFEGVTIRPDWFLVEAGQK